MAARRGEAEVRWRSTSAEMRLPQHTRTRELRIGASRERVEEIAGAVRAGSVGASAVPGSA
eukprot:260563-Rhodomonas_salina.1